MQIYLSYKDYLKNKDLCIIANDPNLGSVKSLQNYASNLDYLKYKNCRKNNLKSGVSTHGMSYVPAPVSYSGPISTQEHNKTVFKATALALIAGGMSSAEVQAELAAILSGL